LFYIQNKNHILLFCRQNNKYFTSTFKPIFFLDEVLIVDRWEKFVRRLADQGYRVYVTGSNAKMLSSEIATTLGGRYIIQNVYPYSFPEYLTSLGIDLADKNFAYRYRSEIIKAFENYFRYGGLPEVTKTSSGKKVSTDTVIDYLGYLKESWLIFQVENICAKLAEKEANKKYYFIDNGILNLFLVDPLTSLLENQVAIQLRRLYGDEVYFYQHGIEVDFYIPDVQLAVQVCYSLLDIETRKREINALVKMSKRIDVRKMIVITKDDEETILEQEIQIEVIPAWKWLCN
jgi:uncharacterized protein